MSSTHYETVYILKSDVAEDVLLRVIDRYQGILVERGGQNIQVENRGKRRLKYPIRKSRDGIYVQMNFEADGEVIDLINKSMKIDEYILRYFTLKIK
jgi:small subunit ribosomal protein S6